MAMQPVDGTEYPLEVVTKAYALVGIAGIDNLNNAIHKAIWDAFTNNRRADRAPVKFKLLNNTYEFPVVKPKRNSYEWYVPKGILKKNWINKHLSLIPAVILIFYDMEWNDPQWNEKVIECASRVQSIRAAVEGHHTRVAVVIVQSSPSPPPSENTLGAERIQALCSACEIQSKHLFVLSHSDHLLGYVVRLESAFYDLAQNYYHHETKNIKSHRDHLNKTTHQYLFVRHQFKMGFFNELKQDISTAHKHYLHAYNNLLEARVVDTNAHEVRTVAGYINYKLCKLLFALNLPRDAIAQLKAHVERYKSRIGYSELIFEHYAWMARQYSSFGELFDEAIRNGLPAVQSQHPGFYYQQASQYTALRRQAMQQLCLQVTAYPPTPDPLEGAVEFYGQRPWRPGRLSADPPDPQKERAAVTALQYNEKRFNHSLMIISLLGSAIAQFKTFRSPRMRKQLVVEMANEYYLCADYGKSLTLLTHMLWDYRRERWWGLASHVLQRALCCAFLSANLNDYLTHAVEALSTNIVLPNNDKARILSNIEAILDCRFPQPEPDLSQNITSEAIEKWKVILEKDPTTTNVDMSAISAFLEVKSRFTKTKYKIDDPVTIETFVRLRSPIALKVSKITLTITSHSENIEIPISDGDSKILTFDRPNKVRKFTCNFNPNPEDCGNDMHLKVVSFHLGDDNKRKLNLNYSLSNSRTFEPNIRPELLHFLYAPESEYDFDNIIMSLQAQLISRESRMMVNVDQASPALLGEWFPITFHLTNDEANSISDVDITLSLVSSSDNPNPETVTELCFDVTDTATQVPMKVNLSELSSEAVISQTFYLKSIRVTNVTVNLKVTYNIRLHPHSPNISCSKDFPIKVNVVKPFEVTAKFVSMKFQPVSHCFTGDPFIVMPEVRILSPWKIILEDADLELSENFLLCDAEKSPSALEGLIVEEDAITADAACIRAMSGAKNQSSVGIYNIKWKRHSENDAQLWRTVLSSAPLPGIQIKETPVNFSVCLPEKKEMRSSVDLNCTLRGSTDVPMRVAVTADSSDDFMFAGYKKRAVTVRPDSDEVLPYNLHPLICGSTSPPNLKISLADLEESSDPSIEIINELLQKNIPDHIYIMPVSKGKNT